MIHRLIYVSRPEDSIDDDDLRSIAEVSLTRNAVQGITGYLYFDSDAFIQEIEGIQQDVEALYASIRRDTRHSSVRTVLVQETDTRAFGNWTMAFHNGNQDGGLLKQEFGDDACATLTEDDGERLLRFLRELSIGHRDVSPVAQTDRMEEA
ncbi:MAG: BLUF domain-containing protein [Pseudomonadota bacterium]